MPRVKDNGDSFTIYVSKLETGDGADGWYGNGRWPCSNLAGKRLAATFDTNGLLDLTVGGRDAPQDLDANELNACVAYFAGQKLPKDHPCYFVAVGQFDE